MSSFMDPGPLTRSSDLPRPALEAGLASAALVTCSHVGARAQPVGYSGAQPLDQWIGEVWKDLVGGLEV